MLSVASMSAKCQNRKSGASISDVEAAKALSELQAPQEDRPDEVAVEHDLPRQRLLIVDHP